MHFLDKDCTIEELQINEIYEWMLNTQELLNALKLVKIHSLKVRAAPNQPFTTD